MNSSRFANCKLSLVLAFLCVTLNTTQAFSDELIIILDPIFYHTPVSEPIAGSHKTALGFYHYDAESKDLEPATLLSEQSRADALTGSLRHAQQLLKTLTPNIFRDSKGVLSALRIDSDDPTLSSILLLPQLGNLYADVLGPDCYFVVPNRHTVFLFPRLANQIQEFGTTILNLFHNDPWPVSREIFENSDHKLRVIGEVSENLGP
ncbi:MAG: hypothetical protein JO076_06720 [Verrucomicrobia bacterium]|nr:hypothetical protein [Verrucomicrobiota bacterium]